MLIYLKTAVNERKSAWQKDEANRRNVLVNPNFIFILNIGQNLSLKAHCISNRNTQSKRLSYLLSKEQTSFTNLEIC